MSATGRLYQNVTWKTSNRVNLTEKKNERKNERKKDKENKENTKEKGEKKKKKKKKKKIVMTMRMMTTTIMTSVDGFRSRSTAQLLPQPGWVPARSVVLHGHRWSVLRTLQRRHLP